MDNYTDVMNTVGRAYILALLEQEDDPRGYARQMGDLFGLDARMTDSMAHEFSKQLMTRALGPAL